ncbi:MAG TPA: hypothetical protein VNL77_21330 [Roseiflexaceae bacterium]|nr:hypothetical protein [Roseiflexaceae bacterium]
MKQAIAGLSAALLVMAMSLGLGYGAVQQGHVQPPIGTLRLGPLTVMSLPPCPTIPGALTGAGRRCGSASPWMVWVVWRGPDGAPHEWKVISMVIGRG